MCRYYKDLPRKWNIAKGSKKRKRNPVTEMCFFAVPMFETFGRLWRTGLKYVKMTVLSWHGPCHGPFPTARTDPLKRCQRSRRRSSSRKPKCPTMPPRVSNATEISKDQQNQKLAILHIGKGYPKVTKKMTSSLDFWRTANNSTSDIQSILPVGPFLLILLIST